MAPSPKKRVGKCNAREKRRVNRISSYVRRFKKISEAVLWLFTHDARHIRLYPKRSEAILFMFALRDLNVAHLTKARHYIYQQALKVMTLVHYTVANHWNYHLQLMIVVMIDMMNNSIVWQLMMPRQLLLATGESGEFANVPVLVSSLSGSSSISGMLPFKSLRGIVAFRDNRQLKQMIRCVSGTWQLAHPSGSLGYSHRIADNTIGNITHDTCKVLWEHLHDMHMKFPMTEDITSIANDFWTK
ncbi:hypothetical protein PR048_032761 [Dryococelus australis]|uniref:Uncharacterized protein n=1 Tax=Dryococelus australis TaxID=614101 RepID=A0ABQ9G344_9NEOP|nr:hypothetical protein PR048_032761 [Dryococelus australis]